MIRSSYFRLRPECYFVKGVKRSAIYNLFAGDMFSLQPMETDILGRCEKNESVDAIIRSICVPSGRVLDFLQCIEKKKMGVFLEKPYYVEKYRDRNIFRHKSYRRNPPELKIGFISMAYQCTLNCWFCLMRDVSRRWGCFGCNIGPLREGTYLTTQEIVDTISQLHAMGCHTLVFRGGDVFIDIKKASAIIQRARQLGFENIFLVTHGIFNSDECFRLLYENEVHPIFQVFPPVKDIYEKITGVTNPLATILLSLGRLKKMGMPFSINLLSEYSIMREMKEAVEFYKALSPSSLLEDVLVSSYMEMQEDGQWDPVKKALLFDKKFAKVSASSFFDRWQFHPCLYGKISINIFGDVSPCPSLYNDVLGNVREKSLPEIFGEEKYQRYWEMSKEKILPCRSCEFRYACDECRGLEKWATGTLTEIKYCSYDLLEGTWTSMPRNRLNNKLEPER